MRKGNDPEEAELSPVVVIMGVSGVGKTTIGRALAARLGWSFVDGDEYHPEANVAKMRLGVPLDDVDRQPWLSRLHEVIEARRAERVPLVLACSALKASYRRQLVGEEHCVVFVYLRAAPDLIASRLERRRGHYMAPTLLASQFDALEPPRDAITVDVDEPVQVIVERIVSLLRASRHGEIDRR